MASQGKRKQEGDVENRESEEEDSSEVMLPTKNRESEEEHSSDDDIVTYASGRKMSRELRDKYHKQVKESDGFEITLDLEWGGGIGAPIIPQRHLLNDELIVELACLGIDKFNQEEDKKYKFEKNVNLNVSFAAGMWCYITFEARDTEATNTDESNTLKTFQTLAWWGIDETRKVKFCRPKKESSAKVDEKPYSNVGVKAMQGEVVGS